jgi:hypothetical protein
MNLAELIPNTGTDKSVYNEVLGDKFGIQLTVSYIPIR